MLNSGFDFPGTRITANLAPAFLRKAGPGFDAALALAVLAASGQVPRDALAGYAVFGELSLGGELRDSPGVLAVAEGARSEGCRRLIVPRQRAREAAIVTGLEVVAVTSLRAAAEVVKGADPPPLPGQVPGPAAAPRRSRPDLRDVRGHRAPLLALEIAAAGGHNLLLEGAPGTGKTMLARRLPSILPALSPTEAIEVTRIHSVAGVHAGGPDQRPAVPGPASHDLALGPGRRRLAAAAGRGDPGAPRGAVSGRAVGVSALQPRRAAPAARGRCGDDRARPAGRCCSRRASCWWRRPTRARAASPASMTAAPAARPICAAIAAG